MALDLNCEWMSLKLSTPLIVASLTPISNARIKEHIQFFEYAVDQGAGAIILPSINPARHGTTEKNDELVEVQIIDAGLFPNDHMAFSVLGPTIPNIVSIEYGLSLASAVKKKLKNTPVIASVVNLGTSDQILDVIKQLADIGIDGFEMNFSCPNVYTSNGDPIDSITSLITCIRTVTNKPISLKLTPYQDYSFVLKNLNGFIDGLTLSNAYIGLIPPGIDNGCSSPFDRTDYWAPGGVYGPFEKPLTFYKLFQMNKVACDLNIDIACVGGIVSGTDAIQAILLGASVVEISSGIQWKSNNVFKAINDSIKDYLAANEYKNIEDIKGIALAKIKDSADDVLSEIRKRKFKVNMEKCMSCKECTCINRLCFAIYKGDDGKAVIDSELCSGCGWCTKVCRFGAICSDDI